MDLGSTYDKDESEPNMWDCELQVAEKVHHKANHF